MGRGRGMGQDNDSNPDLTALFSLFFYEIIIFIFS
jgi:hypothetical protein